MKNENNVVTATRQVHLLVSLQTARDAMVESLLLGGIIFSACAFIALASILPFLIWQTERTFQCVGSYIQLTSDRPEPGYSPCGTWS